MEGTYPLPEAQLDRFMFNILIDYLNEDEELTVATQTTGEKSVELQPVFTGQDIVDFARLVRMVPVADPIARYAVRLAQASRPDGAGAPDFVKNWVSWGAGTRASQNLILGAKARAILNGRFHVSCADIRAVAPPVLRHRILTNFRAEADHVGVENIIKQLLEATPEPTSGLN
jgi:MoxR-like ATPase